MKDFKKFLSNQILQEKFKNDVRLYSYEINISKEKFYKRLTSEYFLMKNVVDENLNENIDRDDIIRKIVDNDWELEKITLSQKFYNSFMLNKKVHYLTPYTVEELNNFNLYKLRGYNIGFAVKNDGDIILVHNNEGVKNIGVLLIDKAKEFGGNHLDHFDGYLTGFYKNCGFNFMNNIIFDKQYAPKTWKYLPLNINNPEESIYAEELKVNDDDFIYAKIRYDNGQPDVVYRNI
jgi:hypothetical protein